MGAIQDEHGLPYRITEAPSAIDPAPFEAQTVEPFEAVDAAPLEPDADEGDVASAPLAAATLMGVPPGPTESRRDLRPRPPSRHYLPRPLQPAPSNGEPLATAPGGEPGQPGLERSATAPQLRRFIKSRAYVPMHELRRRFAINGGDDDVTPVDLDQSRIYVGLPEREGRLLGELLRGGDIGYELSLDPVTPVVVGVYPMRPVTRG